MKKLKEWLKEKVLGVERIVYYIFLLIVLLDLIVLAVILEG